MKRVQLQGSIEIRKRLVKQAGLTAVMMVLRVVDCHTSNHADADRSRTKGRIAESRIPIVHAGVAVRRIAVGRRPVGGGSINILWICCHGSDHDRLLDDDRGRGGSNHDGPPLVLPDATIKQRRTNVEMDDVWCSRQSL